MQRCCHRSPGSLESSRSKSGSETFLCFGTSRSSAGTSQAAGGTEQRTGANTAPALHHKEGCLDEEKHDHGCSSLESL